MAHKIIVRENAPPRRRSIFIDNKKKNTCSIIHNYYGISPLLFLAAFLTTIASRNLVTFTKFFAVKRERERQLTKCVLLYDSVYSRQFFLSLFVSLLFFIFFLLEFIYSRRRYLRAFIKTKKKKNTVTEPPDGMLEI